jgi:hypoxanthine phosphoribosyltransferase
LVERLALPVHESNWKFAMVLCLARGGVRPSDVISRISDVPLAILSTRSYREKSGTKQGNLDIANYMTMTKDRPAGRILLAGSGVTLMKVGDHLKTNYPDVTEVRSVVLRVKGTLAFKPDYHLVDLPHNPWIHEPFEDYDGLRPHQSAWIKKFEKN